MVTHQKFYFFDVGMYRILRPMNVFDTNTEIDGAGLETLFLQSLSAINDYLEAQLHFLYGGSIYEYHDKITVRPFVETLENLPNLLGYQSS